MVTPGSTDTKTLVGRPQTTRWIHRVRTGSTTSPCSILPTATITGDMLPAMLRLVLTPGTPTRHRPSQQHRCLHTTNPKLQIQQTAKVTKFSHLPHSAVTGKGQRHSTRNIPLHNYNFVGENSQMVPDGLYNQLPGVRRYPHRLRWDTPPPTNWL